MNVTAVQQALAAHNLGGWLFFDHHLRDPLAYRILGLEALRHVTRRWYYYVPREGEPVKLVHRVEPHVLDVLPGAKRAYSGWREQRACLAEILAPGSRVAMQYSPECAIPYVAMVDAGTVELIRSLGAEVVSSADLVQEFEARWTDEQYAMHCEAGRRVDAVRAAAFRWIGGQLAAGREPGEFDVYGFIRESFAREALVTDHGPIVAVNAHTADPHYEPTAAAQAQIRPGDFVLIDMWAKLDRARAVYYDITWTGVCGPPDGQVQAVFEVVRRARDQAIARVRGALAAGETLRGYEVDDAARGVIAAAGYGDFFTHRTGHSIGEDVHGAGVNMDNLETQDSRRVIPGVCFSVEPGIYLGPFGVRSEVNVFVGAREVVVTGEVQQALVRI